MLEHYVRRFLLPASPPMAAASNWTELDLPRKYYLGTNTLWDVDANRLGNATPDIFDSVYVQNGEMLDLPDNTNVVALTVADAWIANKGTVEVSAGAR